MQVIGINTIDRKNRVEKDLRNFDLPYPNTIGRGTSVVKDYNVKFLPFLYIINQNGEISAAEMFMKFDDLREIIDGLLAPKDPGDAENN